MQEAKPHDSVGTILKQAESEIFIMRILAAVALLAVMLPAAADEAAIVIRIAGVEEPLPTFAGAKIGQHKTNDVRMRIHHEQ